MQLNDSALIEEIFSSCDDKWGLSRIFPSLLRPFYWCSRSFRSTQKQMAFMLGRQQIFLELNEEMDDYDDLVEIMSNSHLNNHFLSLAREVQSLRNSFFLSFAHQQVLDLYFPLQIAWYHGTENSGGYLQNAFGKYEYVIICSRIIKVALVFYLFRWLISSWIVDFQGLRSVRVAPVLILRGKTWHRASLTDSWTQRLVKTSCSWKMETSGCTRTRNTVSTFTGIIMIGKFSSAAINKTLAAT